MARMGRFAAAYPLDLWSSLLIGSFQAAPFMVKG